MGSYFPPRGKKQISEGESFTLSYIEIFHSLQSKTQEMSFSSQINIFTCLFFPPRKTSLCLFHTARLLLPPAAVKAKCMVSPDSEGAGGSQGTGGSSMPHPVSSCTEKTGYVPASITIFLYIYFGSYAALITMTTACPNYQTYAEAVWLSWQRCSQSGDQRKESPG